MNAHISSMIAFAAVTLMTAAHGSVTEYTNLAAWNAASGNTTTIGFADLPMDTLVTNQYVHLGVLFTEGDDFTDGLGIPSPDGIGLYGNFADTITVHFAQSIHAAGFTYPGLANFQLLSAGQVIYTSSDFGDVSGSFAGAVSTTAFDTMVIGNWGTFGSALIDNLYFSTVPMPSAVALVGFGAVRSRRRL